MAKKYDGIIEAVRYKNGQIVVVRAYERRGAAFSDRILIDRKEFLELVKKGKQYVTGSRTEFMAGTFEQGKPVKQAETEIEHFLHGMTFYARLGPSLRGSYVPLPDTTMYGMVLKQPMGVVAAISPWNFPITLMGTKAGAEWPELTIHGEKAGSVSDTKLSFADDNVGGHQKEIAAFADAILTGKPSPVPTEQSLSVIRILEGLYRSHEAGREVTV